MAPLLRKQWHGHTEILQYRVPALVGKNRIAGIDFTKPRDKQVALVILALSIKPGGFIRKDLANEMVKRGQQRGYSCRNAFFDI